MKRKLVFCLLLLMYIKAEAQSTLHQTSLERDFQEAFELFQKNQYAASKAGFERLKDKPLTGNRKVERDYYYAVSALEVENPDGPSLLEEFILDYPQQPLKNTAAMTLGNHYFGNRNYPKAIESFGKVDPQLTYGEQRPEMLFKTGYAFFQLKNYPQSITYMEQAKRYRSDYLADAYYYAGYGYFQQKEYGKAVQDFQQAEKSKEYAGKVPYMLATIYYHQENFDALIQYAPTVLDRSGLEKKESIHLLLAEAYHEKKDHTHAAFHYGEFVRAKKGTLSRDQQYKAGVSYYQTGKYQESSDFFKEVALVNDQLGQVASYYLGHAYIQLNNPQFASNSFSAAYKSDHDPKIKEEALFNYAKVNLERGNFQDAVVALDTYLNTYSQGSHRREAEDLLSDALINTNNYLRAIEHMEKMPQKSDRIKAAYQKVTFYQGIAYYRDNKFSLALQYFDKSLVYPLDKNLQVQTQFWKGETHAANNNLQEAIKAYERVISMKPVANDPSLIKTHYGLGYAYFNTEQYAKAEGQFKAYTDKLRNNPQKENYHDALIRLGDSYYVQKKLQEALSVFTRAIQENSPYSDYAYFRSGVVLNFENRNREAIRQLDQVISNYPNSLYTEDALFQKAQINMEDTRYAEARDGFTALINSRPNSPFIPYALEGRAVANYSLQQYDRAIEDYKLILDNHPNADNMEEALVGLQESLALQGRSGEFSRYLSEYRKVNPASSNLQNVEFEAAKNLFFNQSYQEAIRALESFVRSYPSAPQVPEARYFLADAHTRIGQNNRALELFYQLENTNDNNLRIRVIQKIGEIEFENGNFSKAIPYFRHSVQNARNKVEEYESNRGLMLAYYETSQYDSAVYFADQVLSLGSITVDAEPRALLIKGKSLLNRGDADNAEKVLMTLMNDFKTEQGAEALYLLARHYHDKGEYNRSNDLIFDHSQPFGGYDYWYGKQFIVLAENYIRLDEKFQAKATLESIVENSNNEQVREEASKLLSTIN